MKNLKCSFLIASVLSASMANASVTVVASDLGYGISAAESNFFGLDFTPQAIWVAGGQRSDNGFSNNHRSGRIFVEFQVTAGMITEANIAGASVSLTFDVLSIGGGVAGTPYTDGLDMRFFGVNAADRTPTALWNTGGQGADQTDLLATSGPTGSSTVGVTNASVLTAIQGASAGDYLAFGYINSVGTAFTVPVGTSLGETYGFNMSKVNADHSLTVSAPVPEPSSTALFGLAGLALILRRRK